jgi:hypothetical protein
MAGDLPMSDVLTTERTHGRHPLEIPMADRIPAKLVNDAAAEQWNKDL